MYIFKNDAGDFGAIMIGAGLAGGIISSIVADKTKRFIELLRISYPLAAIGYLMVTVLL